MTSNMAHLTMGRHDVARRFKCLGTSDRCQEEADGVAVICFATEEDCTSASRNPVRMQLLQPLRKRGAPLAVVCTGSYHRHDITPRMGVRCGSSRAVSAICVLVCRCISGAYTVHQDYINVNICIYIGLIDTLQKEQPL